MPANYKNEIRVKWTHFWRAQRLNENISYSRVVSKNHTTIGHAFKKRCCRLLLNASVPPKTLWCAIFNMYVIGSLPLISRYLFTLTFLFYYFPFQLFKKSVFFPCISSVAAMLLFSLIFFFAPLCYLWISFHVSNIVSTANFCSSNVCVLAGKWQPVFSAWHEAVR